MKHVYYFKNLFNFFSAKEKSTEIATQIEDEMEQQVAMMEEKIRKEEQQKLEQQKQEAHAQLEKANTELNDMEGKIIAVSLLCDFIFNSIKIV